VFSLSRVACCELVRDRARSVSRHADRSCSAARAARGAARDRDRREMRISPGRAGPTPPAARPARPSALRGVTGPWLGVRGSALRREDSRLRLSPPPPWRPARVPDGAPPQVGPQRPSYSYCSLRLYPRRRARRRAWTPEAEPTGRLRALFIPPANPPHVHPSP
jgi:hypothetical protein